MAGYIVKGLWDTDFQREFYGEKYVRFLADLPSLRGDVVSGIGLYLPASLMKGESADFTEVELPPGTKIMKMAPFTITVGNPINLPREPEITYEDLDVAGISVRAIPAS